MTELQRQNTKIIKRLLFIVVGMFGFGFAMVPLYDVFCDITGINGKTRSVASSINDAQVDKSRELTVQFVASVKRGMPWEFKPAVSEMKVHPGEIYKTSFFARNLSADNITGQAIPSVAPGQAALYMNKTACFCFNSQHLKAMKKLKCHWYFLLIKIFQMMSKPFLCLTACSILLSRLRRKN